MRNRKNILGIIAIGVFFTLSACKSVAVLPTNTPVKNVDVNALASKIKGNYPKVNRLRSRIRAVYDDGKRQQQIIVQLRMEAQKTVWMSASMVIPIAKLMVTKQGVSFYEKFQKNYFQGDFELINAPFNTSFTFDDIENLFLGKTVFRSFTREMEANFKSAVLYSYSSRKKIGTSAHFIF
jgi:hypothetical protein